MTCQEINTIGVKNGDWDLAPAAEEGLDLLGVGYAWSDCVAEADADVDIELRIGGLVAEFG